jgi:hypothetical protein
VGDRGDMAGPAEVAVIYYANPCSQPVRDAMHAGRLGCITTPYQGNVTFPAEVDTIADNGCFSARWEHRHWLRWLLDQPRTIRFAVAPDVFHPDGSPAHAETLERWRTYGPLIERHGFAPAFVCQIGSSPDTVPDAPVLFLGGDDKWKEGEVARAITWKAKAEGRWVHMGRVNSERRLRIAAEFGCDSCDGTYLTWGPDTNLPKILRFLARVDAQPSLLSPSSCGVEQ